MSIDPKTLPQDVDTLRKIVVDLIEQLDRSLAEQNQYQNLLRELLEAQRSRKSEQLTKDQLALFEAPGRRNIRRARVMRTTTMRMISAAFRRAASKAARHSTTSGVDARRWRGICRGNGSYTIWQKRKNTAPAAAGTCA